eukprot:scaffold41749_cov212-Skeletonema_marinoi.AAC.3
MVSRKKAKGKARKEAKVKANVEECAAFKPFSSLQFNKSSCTHGWTHDEYAENHDCHKFVVAVLEEFRRTKTVSDTFHAANDATLEKYPNIWKDPTQLVASAFVSIGVEVLVQGDNNDGRRFLVVSSVTFSEWIHQHVAFELHKSVPAMYSARLNELLHADNRRIISYLRKRIPCSCLNVHYNVVKHLPKKGVCCFPDCSHPSRKVELSKMWSCGSCRREHYCSETCQAAEWSCHREDCKVWREWEATEDADSP